MKPCFRAVSPPTLGDCHATLLNALTPPVQMTNMTNVRAEIQTDPLNQHLLDELRAAWGIAPDSPLTVIGQLCERQLGTRTAFFLERLEHPETGVGLAYPRPKETTLLRAFVGFDLPPAIARRTNSVDPESETLWAISQIDLSPLKERERHNNPYECSVRRGTLRLLSEIPLHWNIFVTGRESARRITLAARDAIEERNQEALARALKELSETKERKNDEVARIDEEIKRIETLKSALERELGAVRETIHVEEDRLENICEKTIRETKIMEDRFRHLAGLLTEKWHRLVALNLIDEDDLETLLPNVEVADERIGHDFHGVLDGDFARLAPFIQARLWKKGMLFSLAQLRDFLALVRTHDLVVLAGDSGSGKTSLIRAVAESISGQCTVIPVKPNWTSPDDLLGYYNAVELGYQPTQFLLALQAAAKEPNVPHFICLDEMNIAQVEHYFADFLSLLETRSESPIIPLYTSNEERHTVLENNYFLTIEAEARARAGLPETATMEDLLKDDQANSALHQLGGFKDAESVLLHHARLRRALATLVRTPASLRFPQNVRIFGAINIDETTHYLSPKVLDRVHVMRFRNPVLTDWDDLEAEVQKFDIDLDAPARLSARDLGAREDYPPFDRSDENAAFLMGLARRQLDPLGVEFGLRAIRQSMGYMREAENVGIEKKAALNNIVLHKILPKLMLDTARTGGDGRNRRDVLIALREELSDNLTGLELTAGAESSVDALDRLIAAAAGNNGIANYWLR